jgi:hypothetical protein
MAGLLGIAPEELALIGGLLSGKKGENWGQHFMQLAAAQDAKKRQKMQEEMWQEEMGLKKEDRSMRQQQIAAQQEQQRRQQEQEAQRQQALAQMFQNDPRMQQLAQLDPKMALERSFPKPQMQFAPNGQAVDMSQLQPGGNYAPAEKPDIRFAPNGQVVDMRQVKPGTSFAPPREPKEPSPGQYDAARGVIIDPRTGQAKPVTMPDGSPLAPKDGKGEKPLTEGQAKGSMYLGMMENAEKSIAKIKGFDPTKLTNQTMLALARGDVPVIGKAGNLMAGAAPQQYAQATFQWTEAMLRQLTGAAAPEQEVWRQTRTFWPMPGDSPEVVAQKAQARAAAQEQMKIVAGPGAAQVAKQGGASGGWGIREIK